MMESVGTVKNQRAVPTVDMLAIGSPIQIVEIENALPVAESLRMGTKGIWHRPETQSEEELDRRWALWQTPKEDKPKMDIRYCNREILKFMGYKQITTTLGGQVWDTPFDTPEADPFKLQGANVHLADYKLRFNSSWDQLLLGIEKALSVMPDARESDIWYSNIHDALWSLNIKTTWEKLVEFIVWYNLKQMEED